MISRVQHDRAGVRAAEEKNNKKYTNSFKSGGNRAVGKSLGKDGKKAAAYTCATHLTSSRGGSESRT
jgi:hypothetical protein